MLSPQKAADRADVSRKTIMDAISIHRSLKAIRDNRNRWQIDPQDLEEWMASRKKKTTTSSSRKPPHDGSSDIIRLEEQLKLALKEADNYHSQLQRERAERQEEREAAQHERQRLQEEARVERERLLQSLETVLASQRRLTLREWLFGRRDSG